MVNDSFVFRSGEYTGKTVGLVKKLNPSYIKWVQENRPEMLKERKSFNPIDKPTQKVPRKEVPDDSEVEPKTTLKENTNFLNEKGDYSHLEDTTKYKHKK